MKEVVGGEVLLGPLHWAAQPAGGQLQHFHPEKAGQILRSEFVESVEGDVGARGGQGIHRRVSGERVKVWRTRRRHWYRHPAVQGVLGGLNNPSGF